MKKFIAIAVLGFSVSLAQAQSKMESTAPAQVTVPAPGTPAEANTQVKPAQKGTIEERATAQVARLTKKLNLTDDQKAKVYNIIYTSMKEAETAHQAVDADRMAKFEKRKALMEATDNQVKAVLNADQLKKYEQMKADREAKMEERRAQRQNGGGGHQGGDGMGGGY
jgi:Spy/CpxP family protein refolding chaperone